MQPAAAFLLPLLVALVWSCQRAGEEGTPAGTARLLAVEALAWPETPPGVVVERWRVDHPAGGLELLVARPHGPVRALGLLANRAVHHGADTLRGLLPLAAAGHVLAAADWFRAPWATGGGETEDGAARLDRAVAWQDACLDLLQERFGVPAARTWLLGGSRGTVQVAALAARRPQIHHLALVAPVAGGGETAAGVQAVAGRGGRIFVASGRRDPMRSFQESLRPLAGGALTWVDLDAAHVFSYEAVLAAGLQEWLATIAGSG